MSPEEADAVVAIFAAHPDDYDVRCCWERVQSIVAVHKRGEASPFVSYLMPVCG